MSIDTYAPCPGGTGKKIKFCCADLVGDLEQLERLIEGDQISAALDQVRRLDEQTPGRPCLLATRVKLELGSKKFAEAAATSHRFRDAFPDNPVALGNAAVTEAVAGNIQEAAALFDKAREAAGSEPLQDTLPLLTRIAATLVQAAAQAGHSGFAQGLVDWLVDRRLGTQEELRLLAAIVGSGGVPPALRTRMRLAEATADAPWRPDFDTGLRHARDWRLGKALTAFRSLKAVAGKNRELFTNIAVLSEMLARPMEASEAWLVVAGLADGPADESLEATARAIALETEADPDRSPQVRFLSIAAPLAVPTGEEGVTALELLEDKCRHDPRCEPAAFDRSAWVSRGTVPPRTAWRVYAAGTDAAPARTLASLLVFGRQTDHEPEAVLQGFAPDVAEAQPFVESLAGCRFAPAAAETAMPAVSPTNWLAGAQFRMPLPTAPVAPAAAGDPALVDTLMARQHEAVWTRFAATWPDTPLPELLGKSPRQSLADAEGRRRVEALVTEGEATSRLGGSTAAWRTIRASLALAEQPRIAADRPLEEVSPLCWHRLDMGRLDLEQLRGVLVTAIDAGFDRAAELAAEAVVARTDAAPADRWEAFGVLEDRAETSVRKLEIVAHLRAVAKELKAGDGMLDVAELRVRLQRGDQAEIVRLLEHVQREHGRDAQVLQALAQVLMEAGIDLGALAGRPPGGAAAAGAMPAAAAAEPGKLWTPGGSPAAGGGEKKTIWTPD
jgi:hypothetical protein